MSWHEWTWAATCPDGWAHHNLATLPDGTIVGYHPRDRALVFFDEGGATVGTTPCDAREAHDIAVAADGLWIADCSSKLVIGDDGSWVDIALDDRAGQVVLVDLDGTTRTRLGPPDHPVYTAGGSYNPTGIALDPRGRGVWIADGYGSNLVHLVSTGGRLVLTIDGFDCPHGVRVHDELLYVADRRNRRVQVHDLDGGFVRTIGDGHLSSPSALAFGDDRLYVAELLCRLTVFDGDGGFVEHIGSNEGSLARKGWPNALDDGGRTVPPSTPEGLFNSPHGVTVGRNGTVYVTEWSLGGRWIRISEV